VKTLVASGLLFALIASVAQAQTARQAGEDETTKNRPAAKKPLVAKKRPTAQKRATRSRATRARTNQNFAANNAVGQINAYRAPNNSGFAGTTLQPNTVTVNGGFGGLYGSNYGGYGYGLNGGGYYGGNYGYGLNLGAVGGGNGNLAPGNSRSNNNSAPATGVTSGPVLNNNLGFQTVGGQYVPGYGVNNGFPTPTQVYGGTYVPGYGVNNGFAAPVQLYGGTYIPGFGVNNGFARPEAVAGGFYTPGYGVQGGAALGGTGGGFGTAVHGGSLVPGFGVVSGIR
jgi:hypothetical protein